MKRFPALDGLRAFAAIAVVFYHYGEVQWRWLSGWIGVQLFFVLSGFLITTLALREESRFGKISLRNFYVRRFFRILPVYFLLLAVTVLVFANRDEFFGHPLQAAFPEYLLFWNEFADGTPYGQSWSLGIEQKFYIVWPLLAFGFLAAAGRAGRGRLALACGGIVLSLVAIPATLDADPKGWPVHYVSVLTGCVVALIMHSPRGFALVAPLTKPKIAGLVAIAFCVVQWQIRPLSEFLGHHNPWDIPGFVAVCPIYAFFVAMLLVAVVGPGPVRTVLSTRIMNYLGERSYSIYLVQVLAGLMVVSAMPSLHGTGKAIGVLVVSIIAADVLYRHVEVPMIALGRRFLAARVVMAKSEPIVEYPRVDVSLEKVGSR
ncbi:acyltransferase [Antrihabitans sp. YC2-6]|uniref:acyltransferase family protein n=1 Tax=Antrihabitans sp. YC2-6 TaxID=2799498 RepID=UPI0018F65D07|nr:acyltransferase [Antrihabitans sp. YC2-6]MBJ8345432.1 acyltransferase [Antrihabitans sp. YC2-6]